MVLPHRAEHSIQRRAAHPPAPGKEFQPQVHLGTGSQRIAHSLPGPFGCAAGARLHLDFVAVAALQGRGSAETGDRVDQ